MTPVFFALLSAGLLPVRPRAVLAAAVGAVRQAPLLATSSFAAVRQAPLLATSSFAAGIAVGCAVSSDVLDTFQTAADVPNRYIRGQKSIRGKVAAVADGDTLRLRHMPVPLISSGKVGKLSEDTIQVRLLAVDAPEIGKFGSASQPFAEEAKSFVQEAVLGTRVRVRCIGRDRYGRLIGEVRFGLFGRSELSAALLRRGLAVVYRGKDGSYGDRRLQGWERIEAEAKRRGSGMWKDGSKGVSPGEYKRRLREKRGS